MWERCQMCTPDTPLAFYLVEIKEESDLSAFYRSTVHLHVPSNLSSLSQLKNAHFLRRKCDVIIPFLFPNGRLIVYRRDTIHNPSDWFGCFEILLKVRTSLLTLVSPGIFHSALHHISDDKFHAPLYLLLELCKPYYVKSKQEEKQVLRSCYKFIGRITEKANNMFFEDRNKNNERIPKHVTVFIEVQWIK